MEFKIFFSSKALNVGNFLKRTISEESSNDKSIATAYEGLGFSYDSLSCKTLSADQCSKSSQDHVLLPWDLPFPELRGHESLYPVRQRSAVPIESSCICSRRDRDQQRTKGKGQSFLCKRTRFSLLRVCSRKNKIRWRCTPLQVSFLW